MKINLERSYIMTKLQMAKAIGLGVVSVGVGSIVGNIIIASTPANIGILRRVCIYVGGLVITDMACDHVGEYAEKKLDNMVEQVKSMVVTSA